MAQVTKAYTFTNGQVADGTQVNKNFDDILTAVNGNIDANNIADASVTAVKLATDAVETAKIKAANVTAAKMATDSVATANIIAANVTAAKLATDINTKVLLAGSVYALTDGATIALDWVNGATQKVTLAGNRTFTFANPVAGQVYRIMLIQDGTGSRTITWPTIRWAGGTAPTLTTTASKADIVTLLYDGTSYFGSATLNF